MPTMVEVPGLGQVEFPDSMDEMQIEQVIRNITGHDKPSAGMAFTREASGEFLGNLARLSPLKATLDVASKLTGKRMTPDKMDLFGGAQRMGEFTGALRTMDFGQFEPDARQQQMDISQQFKEQRPLSSGLGELTGDAATLITGRAPMAQFLARNSFKLPVLSTTPGALRIVDRILRSTPMKALARTAGRSVETGLEGAVLAILNDSDPMETAAYAAGGQALGSIGTGLLSGIFSGGPMKAGLKFGVTAAAIAGLLQVAKEAVPGGRDRVLESIEAGYEKVMWSLLLGGLSGILGAGRLRGSQFAEDLPLLADAITALPRGLILSKLTDITKTEEEGNNVPSAVITKLSQDPTYFGGATSKLQDALTKEGESFTQTIEELMKDDDFRKRIENINFSEKPPAL